MPSSATYQATGVFTLLRPGTGAVRNGGAVPRCARSRGIGENDFDKRGWEFKLAVLDGVVAQLVEHHNGIVGVRGSNPLGSTILRSEPPLFRAEDGALRSFSEGGRVTARVPSYGWQAIHIFQLFFSRRACKWDSCSTPMFFKVLVR